MTTAIVPVEQMERMATSLVKSGFFGLQNVEQAIVLMAIAQEEGKGLVSVARDYNVIEGRPAKKSEAMLRDFCAPGAGGTVKWHTLDDTIADATFSHPTGGTIRIQWDIPRAQKAGLVGRKGDMYAKYPRAMLRSRCIAEGVRTVGPFATGGLYTPEEVREIYAQAELINVTREPDTDQTPPPPEGRKRIVGYLEVGAVLDHCAAIEGAADLEDLRQKFRFAYETAKKAGDFKAIEQFERKKDARKRELTAEDA